MIRRSSRIPAPAPGSGSRGMLKHWAPEARSCTESAFTQLLPANCMGAKPKLQLFSVSPAYCSPVGLLQAYYCCGGHHGPRDGSLEATKTTVHRQKLSVYTIKQTGNILQLPHLPQLSSTRDPETHQGRLASSAHTQLHHVVPRPQPSW